MRTHATARSREQADVSPLNSVRKSHSPFEPLPVVPSVQSVHVYVVAMPVDVEPCQPSASAQSGFA